MDLSAVTASARQLLGTAAGGSDALAVISGFLDMQNVLRAFTAYDPGGQIRCVDGAVISRQTDVVTWIAVAATDSAREVEVQVCAVTPVGGHVDAVRGAVMAAAELQAAVRCAGECGQVWMDGSLATPLISIATSLSAVPADAADAFAAALDELGVVDSAVAYVDLAMQGRVRALPKQDSSRVFADLWARQLDADTARWLERQRDRSLMAALLPAGACLAPRPAPEIAAIDLPPVCVEALGDIEAGVRDALRTWRSAAPYVSYLMPTNLNRPIKYEFTVAADSDPDSALAVGAQLAGQIDRRCCGPLILEPLPQYVVDVYAKQSVQLVNQLLIAAVQRDLGHRFPELSRGYRT